MLCTVNVLILMYISCILILFFESHLFYYPIKTLLKNQKPSLLLFIFLFQIWPVLSHAGASLKSYSIFRDLIKCPKYLERDFQSTCSTCMHRLEVGGEYGKLKSINRIPNIIFKLQHARTKRVIFRKGKYFTWKDIGRKDNRTCFYVT